MATRFRLRTADGPTRLPPERVRIDGYHVLQLVGEEPDASVYRAVRVPATIEVALKVLVPDRHGDESRRRRFLHRGQATKRVNHAHVVPCWDVGVSHGTPFYVIELDPGRRLADEELVADPARGIGLVLELALGLEAIHLEGLAHGAIHPGNIHLTAETGARLGELAEPPHPERDADIVEAWLAAGAAFPPEWWRVQGDEEPRADIRADTWALGALLLRQATGTVLHAPRRDAARRAATVSVRELPALGALSPGLQAVLRKALASEPQQRYQTPSQLREDLERLQFDFQPIHAGAAMASADASTSAGWSTSMLPVVQPPAVTQPPVPPPAHPPLRTWLLPALAAVALLIGMAGLWWSMRQQERQTEPPASEALPLPPIQSPAAVAAPVAVGAPAAPPLPTWMAAQGEDRIGAWAEIDCGDGGRLRLRRIAAGTFWMGSAVDELDRADDERRVLVTISRPFWIGATEVTQAQWQAVMGGNPGHFRGGVLPVESVTWTEAVAFCDTLGQRHGARVRLPTEAEWEYACRAGAAGAFALDRPVETFAWLRGNAAAATHPVGTLAANAWGLFDVHGNVLEWCADAYGPYPEEAAADPHRDSGIHRVARGGAWTLGPAHARAAARHRVMGVNRFFFLGLRVVVEDAVR